VQLERGGLLGSSRANLAAYEPPEALMTVAVACVTIGFGEPEAWSSSDGSAPEETQAPAARVRPPPPPVEASAPAARPLGTADAAGPQGAFGVPPSPAEMEPGSAEMLARAKDTAAQWADRIVTPLEAFALLAEEEDVEVVDVRTGAQRAGHAINGRAGVSVMGALSIPLDDVVAGRASLPPADKRIVLVCSRGPKSLVALGYLAEAYPRAVCVEGGITAWDSAHLPTEDASGGS
jgi:rhodanese-related sulfurtransferase